MRLRIVHQLSLLLIGGILLALLAMGGFVSWNLKAGFSDYLRARDGAQLQRFAALLTQRAQHDPSMVWLSHNRVAMRELMDAFATQEGLRPAGPQEGPRDGPAELTGEGPGPRPVEAPGPGPDAEARMPPPDVPGFEARRPPPRREPDRQGAPPRPRLGPPERLPPADAIAPDTPFQRRVSIDAPDGQRIAGRPLPPGQTTLDETIRVNGVVVATVRLLVAPELQEVDTRFLKRQYTGLGSAVLITLLVGLLAAWLAARRFTRPLRELQQATRQIAQGRLDVQITPFGAQELAELMGDVNTMAASLHKLEAARRAWIAQMSHELRTPLAVLRGELEAIEDGARQASRAVIHSLQEEVLQLIRLVNDLHTLSMADLGDLRCEFTDGDAVALLARCCQRFEARMTKAGLELQWQPPQAELRVRWDFGRIEQVMTNLLENSVRYTRAAGQVRVHCQLVQSKTRKEIEIWVQDSAPGVRPDELAQLFEPLYRADPARQRQACVDDGSDGSDAGDSRSSSGLGLAIVRAIVQAHRGTVVATHAKLGGVAVCVRLPIDAEARP